MADDALASQYDKASALASQVGRQLAFAGVGIVWLFSGVNPAASQPWVIPLALRWAGLALALCLTLDLFHAIYRAISFGLMQWLAEEEEAEPSPHLDLPRWVHWPSLALFYLKFVCLVAAYLFIVWHLAHQLG